MKSAQRVNVKQKHVDVMEICHIRSGYTHLVLSGHIFPTHKCDSTHHVMILNPIIIIFFF